MYLREKVKIGDIFWNVNRTWCSCIRTS